MCLVLLALQALQRLSPSARLALVVADPSAAAGRVQLLAQLLGAEPAAVQQSVLEVPQVLLWAERLLVSTLEALEVVSQPWMSCWFVPGRKSVT
jgi:hypothetical protein